MEPSGPTSGIPRTLLNRLQPVSLPLQVGQQLQATVLENTAGKILLTIGNRQLSAESSLPFEPGQVLTLQVRSVGEQPVLKVVAALQESATAMAVRMLLPRYGPTTPLLASLSQLTATPNIPLPPPVTEIARALVRSLPDAVTLSTPEGVKSAIRNSGSFLEHHLVQATGTGAHVPVSFDNDFKANLLRLLQLVRSWPGGQQSESPPATQPPEARAPAPAQAAHAMPLSPPGPAADRLATGVPTGAPAATPAPTASTATAQQPPAAQPQTLERAINSAGTRLPPGATVAPGAPAPPATNGREALPQIAAEARSLPAPPFAGVVPTPQAPVRATIDLLNRLGHLRLDLLQQTEAALARIHLNQLASLPREADHRLVEWLFDIPVRRGDTIDLWSARVYRDADEQSPAREQAAARWRVQLAFDLPGLGPIQAQINLHGERVSTHFWTSEADTLPLLRQHLHELRRGMLAAGLEVGDIDCQQGAIPGSAGGPRNPLINETA